MNKQEYKELVSDLLEGQDILKKQLHNSKNKIIQLECLVADLKDEFLDMGGDEDTINYIEKQCNTVTINKWEN